MTTLQASTIALLASFPNMIQTGDGQYASPHVSTLTESDDPHTFGQCSRRVSSQTFQNNAKFCTSDNYSQRLMCPKVAQTDAVPNFA